MHSRNPASFRGAPDRRARDLDVRHRAFPSNLDLEDLETSMSGTDVCTVFGHALHGRRAGISRSCV